MTLFFDPKDVTDCVAIISRPSDRPITKQVFRCLTNGVRYHGVNDGHEEIGNQTVTANVTL